MELRQLEYFLTVAREQNITRASKVLHISQPALSIQLKSLEAEIGKPLLIRGKKGSRKIALTEEGQILQKRAEEILSLMEKTEEELSSPDSSVVGHIYIGAGETKAVRVLAQAAKQIQKDYPLISYHISSGNAEHVFEYLNKGLIDFGLLFTTVDTQKYECIEIPVQDTWGVLMRKDARLANKAYITPEDLWNQPLIISHQKGEDDLLGMWLGQKKSHLHIVATYNLIYNASLLVEEGLGYAMCYDGLINTRGSNLCFRPLQPALQSVGKIVWRKNAVFSKAARIFLQEIQTLLKEQEE